MVVLAWRDYGGSQAVEELPRKTGVMDSTAVDGSNKSISPGHGQRLSSHESDLLESSGERYRSNARREVFEGPIAGIVVTTYSSRQKI